MKRMKIFWCPSGKNQYDPASWQGSVHLSTGYVQYCSRDEDFYTRIGGVRKPENRVLEHSPMKNISRGAGWITFVDISTNGSPVERLRSNHFKNDLRFDPPTGGNIKVMGSAGANALHVGGNVTWYGPHVMNFDSSKCFMAWMKTPSIGIAYDSISWWMFPRTH